MMTSVFKYLSFSATFVIIMDVKNTETRIDTQYGIIYKYKMFNVIIRVLKLNKNIQT